MPSVSIGGEQGGAGDRWELKREESCPDVTGGDEGEVEKGGEGRGRCEARRRESGAIFAAPRLRPTALHKAPTEANTINCLSRIIHGRECLETWQKESPKAYGQNDHTLMGLPSLPGEWASIFGKRLLGPTY